MRRPRWSRLRLPKAPPRPRPSPRSSRRASPKKRNECTVYGAQKEPRESGAFCFNGPMSRLTRIEKNQTTGETRELLENVAKLRGNVPNMFRVYAHRPEILKTMVAHMNAVTGSGTVPVRTKELVATLVSRINHCEY